MMHKHYKVDEIALKNLQRNNLSPTASNNEIKHYLKFND